MSGLAEVFGGSAFDVNTVEPQGDFDVLPPGKYPVLIEKSEVKRTKKGDGAYLELAMSVLDGPGKNRKLWNRINVSNPSQKCVEIGFRQLSALGRATGVAVVNDENQFLQKTCIASVIVKDNQNEVRTYLPLANATPDIAVPAYAPPGRQAGLSPLPGEPLDCRNSPPADQQPQPAAVGAPTAPPWARG